MKPRWWPLSLKWAADGVLLLAISILTVACSDGWGAEKTPQPGPPDKAAPARHKNSAPSLPDEPRVELERLDQAAQQKTGKGKVGNAFGATSWYVPPPPPPPVKPAPPPPPSAPPMPFAYLGLYEGAVGKVIMLVKGDHVYTVSVGDVIENTYRVDSVEQGIVELTYLPLNIKQSINTGNSL
jgi:hypothetical protein